jgi:hypothetical protein
VSFQWMGTCKHGISVRWGPCMAAPGVRTGPD